MYRIWSVPGNSNINIEISAYTDDIGTEQFNKNLSEERAASVMDYMVRNNISPSRLGRVGYGELRPLFANDSEENRAKNRRVEIKVTTIN